VAHSLVWILEDKYVRIYEQNIDAESEGAGQVCHTEDVHFH